jgi:hypothetical protein
MENGLESGEPLANDFSGEDSDEDAEEDEFVGGQNQSERLSAIR